MENNNGYEQEREETDGTERVPERYDSEHRRYKKGTDKGDTMPENKKLKALEKENKMLMTRLAVLLHEIEIGKIRPHKK